MKPPLTEFEQAHKAKLFREAAVLKREYKVGRTTAEARSLLRSTFFKLWQAVQVRKGIDGKAATAFLRRLGIADETGMPVAEFGGEPTNPKPRKKRTRR